MTLILGNEEIERLLPMADCLERLEQTYVALGRREAANRPRSDIYAPSDDPTRRYIFKTMDAVLPFAGVAALRLNSDVIVWEKNAVGVRKDKQPMAPGGRWVGLILLFSTQTGEPLAIMPDGVIQQLRVGGTNGVAAKLMAPPEARVYALLGAGEQAATQAAAMAAVRPLKQIRVYSPTRERRERFAAVMSDRLHVPIVAVDSPEQAVRGADVVGAATNSIRPVMEAGWVEPHAHVSCIRVPEAPAALLEQCKLVVVHSRTWAPANYIVGRGEEPVYAHDPREALGDDHGTPKGDLDDQTRLLSQQPDLGELAAGQVTLPPPGSLTCFVNVVGLGVQFAALGSLAYERAREQGVGREIPTDWLTESVHP
jgi:alanine dehydrogenase